MSYASQADLAGDQMFLRRLTACTQEQAEIFTADGRPEIASLARRVLADAGLVGWFVWPVATAPGFGDAGGQSQISDGQLLATVQALWPTIAEIHPEPSEPPAA